VLNLVSVRLGLVRAKVRVRFSGFNFYVQFVCTKPNALLSCVTVTSQVAHE